MPRESEFDGYLFCEVRIPFLKGFQWQGTTEGPKGVELITADPDDTEETTISSYRVFVKIYNSMYVFVNFFGTKQKHNLLQL